MIVNEKGFRRIALGMKGSVEGAHLGHPDFRVGNRVFVTLQHDRAFAGLMLTPQQQAQLLRSHPNAFTPAAGAWGRAGTTIARLAAVDEETLGEAVTLAWQNAVAKGPVRPAKPGAASPAGRGGRRPKPKA
jgi:YjbR